MCDHNATVQAKSAGVMLDGFAWAVEDVCVCVCVTHNDRPRGTQQAAALATQCKDAVCSLLSL